MDLLRLLYPYYSREMKVSLPLSKSSPQVWSNCCVLNKLSCFMFRSKLGSDTSLSKLCQHSFIWHYFYAKLKLIVLNVMAFLSLVPIKDTLYLIKHKVWNLFLEKPFYHSSHSNKSNISLTIWVMYKMRINIMWI